MGLAEIIHIDTYQVDFEYPVELHKSHDDYSLAPKKLEINRSMPQR